MSDQAVSSQTSLDETKIKVMLAWIRMGMDYTQACIIARISIHTMKNWMREGRAKPESQYGALLENMDQARAEFEGSCLKEANLTHLSGRAAEYKTVVDSEVEEIGPDGKTKIINRTYKSIKIKDEIKPNPDIMKWLLERKFGAKWGQRIQLNVAADPLSTAMQEEIKDVTPTKTQEQELEEAMALVEQMKMIQAHERKDGE